MTAGLRYFAFSTLFLVALCVFSIRTPPVASAGADFFVLGLTYGVVLAALGGVFGALRLIRQVDGEMDWGGVVPTTAKPLTSESESVRSAPTI